MDCRTRVRALCHLFASLEWKAPYSMDVDVRTLQEALASQLSVSGTRGCPHQTGARRVPRCPRQWGQSSDRSTPGAVASSSIGRGPHAIDRWRPVLSSKAIDSGGRWTLEPSHFSFAVRPGRPYEKLMKQLHRGTL